MPKSQAFENSSLTDSDECDIGTSVTLVGFKEAYHKHCPKQFDTIARRIIEHFLVFFVLDTCPKIILEDEYGQRSEVLNDIFKEDVAFKSTPENFTLDGHAFRVYHLRLRTKAREPQHKLHFCALKRSVETRDLSKLLPNLRGPLSEDAGGQFLYAGYVTSHFFEGRLNQERTRLEFLQDKPIIQDQESEPNGTVAVVSDVIASLCRSGVVL